MWKLYIKWQFPVGQLQDKAHRNSQLVILDISNGFKIINHSSLVESLDICPAQCWQESLTRRSQGWSEEAGYWFVPHWDPPPVQVTAHLSGGCRRQQERWEENLHISHQGSRLWQQLNVADQFEAIVSSYTVSGCLECDKGWTGRGRRAPVGKQWQWSGTAASVWPVRLDTTTGAAASSLQWWPRACAKSPHFFYDQAAVITVKVFIVYNTIWIQTSLQTLNLQ